MEIEQINDIYKLNISQELEQIDHELQQALKYNDSVNIQDYALKYIFAIQKANYLYFPFGKYKGRIVQDVVTEDLNYCKWFLQYVFADTMEVARILDYLNKYITFHNKNYMFVDLETCLSLVQMNFIEHYPKVYKNWEHHKQMITDDYKRKQKTKCNTHVDIDFDLSSPEDDSWGYYGLGLEDIC